MKKEKQENFDFLGRVTHFQCTYQGQSLTFEAYLEEECQGQSLKEEILGASLTGKCRLDWVI